MRLEKLRLIAYGPFTNVELDLAGGATHVIYGKNEAGKSTALRAITGLLYGIARNTPDAHVHRMPELRVGGTLRAPDGKLLEIVRRKGKDNTLLDREGRPIEEAVLSRFLGGVSQEQFLGMFGLDHVSLRRGGEALLLGGGNVGESLFGAAMSGGELHRVLRELATEADALFTPKGYTKPLNEALKAFAEAEKRTREQSTSPEAMREQESGLAELRRDQKDCESDRQRLYLERTKLERLRRALPLLAKRKTALDRRRELGDAVLLPPHATAARAEQVRVIDEAGSEVTRLTAHLAALTERRAQLTLPESLVRFDEVPLDLGRRLGTYAKTLAELPRLRAEIEDEEAEARAALHRAGRDVTLESAASFRVNTAVQSTVHKLALENAKWHEGKAHTQRSLVEHRARIAALLASREKLPPARDPTPLKKAIARAERDGQLEERLVRARTERTRIDERARAEVGALGLGERAVIEVTAMPVPAPETVERFAQQKGELDDEARQTAERKGHATARLDALDRELDALQRGGHVPSESDLTHARERRDAVWQRLRAGLPALHAEGAPKSRPKGRPRATTPLFPTREADKHEVASRDAAIHGAATPPLAPLDVVEYEASVRAADDLADRLRREAERVTRLASLGADRDACRRELATLAARERDVTERTAQTDRAWCALWAPLGVVPHPPREMKTWLVRHGALARTSEALGDAAAAVVDLEQATAAHRQRIIGLLAEFDTIESSAAPSLDEPCSPDGAPAAWRLAELIDHAGELAARLENATFERRQLDREIAEQSEQLAALALRDEEHEAARVAFEKAWKEAVAPLGLGEHASPEQVTATIELLEKAVHHLDQADLARRRAGALEREAAAFRSDVERVAEDHAPDLTQQPADRAAAEIVDRYHRGRSALAARRELDRQLFDAERQLEGQRERHAVAVAKMNEMMRAAGAHSLEALERAERASDEIRALELDLARFDEELEALGGAATLGAEAGDADIDAVTVRLADVDIELEQLRERASMLDRRIGSAEAGLKDLEDPKAKAADAAADAEAALARVRELSQRYLRARAACIVLGREIENYRQKNQGPILTAASAHFRKLTLGSFTGLRTDFDEEDQPVLRGVRTEGGADIGVDAMSDGTRDQLYLALRVATLERYAEQGNPMPMVLDDILVHFDDDRARAALELIGELSDRLQVLFFTHHARLVELARETIAPHKLSVRELTDARSSSVGAAAGALLGSARK